MKKIHYRNFKDARKFVKTLKLNSQKEWREYYKSDLRPIDIPTNPPRAYNKEWTNWGDWLGTGNIAPQDRQYISFENARKFIQTLNLKGSSDWAKYCKSGNKPEDIPQDPRTVYKKEWKGTGDWFGTGTIANTEKKFLPFKKAREIVRNLKLKNQNEWRKFVKTKNRPQNIPTAPKIIYNKEWISMSDWLGNTHFRGSEFKSFAEAKNTVHSLNIQSQTYWRKFVKSGDNPNDIPSAPSIIYKKDWLSWGDWLGTDEISPSEKSQQYLNFKEAKKQVRILAKKYGLKNWDDWNKAVKEGKIPKNIPLVPNRVYRKGRQNEKTI